MNDNPAPPQDALSDLEWMRQRMAKPAVEDSGTTTCRLDPLPTTKADMKRVRPRNAIHSTPCHLTQLEIARSSVERSNTRHHSWLFVQNLPFSCTDEDLKGLFKPFGEISQVGLLLLVHFPLEILTGAPVSPAGEITF